MYPKRMRGDRGAELLDTLLELSHPGQRRPAPTQVAAVLRAGLRARSGADQPLTLRQVWHAALPVAGTLLLVQAALQGLMGGIGTFAVRSWGLPFSYTLSDDPLTIAWALRPLLPLIAVCVARSRVALALTLLSPGVVLAALLITADPGTMSTVATLAALADGCAPAVLLLPWLLRRPQPGPCRWQVGVPSLYIALPVLAGAASTLAGMTWTPWLGVVPAGAAVLALALILTWGVLIDARAALATGVLLLWTGLSGVRTAMSSYGFMDDWPSSYAFMGGWLGLLVLSAIGLIVLTTGLWTAGRQRAR